jgi:hypothetical protein
MHELLLDEEKPAVPVECCDSKPLMYYHEHWKVVECKTCGKKKKSMAWEVAIHTWNQN